MRSFRGPLDPEDSDDDLSEPDEIEDEIHAVFMAPGVAIEFNEEEDAEAEALNPGVHLQEESNDGPIFMVENDNNEEDHEVSTSSDNEPLDYDSAEEGDEDSAEETEPERLQPSFPPPISPTPTTVPPDAPPSPSAKDQLPFADASDSEDLSSLDSTSDSVPGPDGQICTTKRVKDAQLVVEVEDKMGTMQSVSHLAQEFVSQGRSTPETISELVPSSKAIHVEEIRRKGENWSRCSESDSTDESSVPQPPQVEPGESGEKRKHDSSPSSVNCKRFAKAELEEEAEENKLEYSNPMASDLDGLSVDEEAFRGDRIGNSTYGERHVLRILMRWIQDLEQYTGSGVKENGKSEEERRGLVIKLERDFDKELSLLWDMSSENDVMSYLVEKDVFQLLQNTLVSSACNRLSEIALGILANLLSSSALLSTFPVVDEKFGLVDQVVTVAMSTAHVPILIQAFAVFRRVVWYIRNVEPMENWISAFVSEQFVTMVNFLLKSSTNVLLLGDLIVTMFSLFETMISDGVEKERGRNEAEAEGHLEETNPKYDVFCKGGFVVSLCEALAELLKYPDDYGMKELIDDVQVPPGHIQTAIRYGLGCLCYLHKAPNGRAALRRDKRTVLNFLVEFHEKFHLVTESIENDKALEYLVSGFCILAFCHADFPVVQPKALIQPILAACTLKEKEEGKCDKKSSPDPGTDSGTDTMPPTSVPNSCSSSGPASASELVEDILSSIAIVVHEHLAELSDKFGSTVVQSVLSAQQDKRLNRFIHFAEETAQSYRVQQQSLYESSN